MLGIFHGYVSHNQRLSFHVDGRSAKNPIKKIPEISPDVPKRPRDLLGGSLRQDKRWEAAISHSLAQASIRRDGFFAPIIYKVI